MRSSGGGLKNELVLLELRAVRLLYGLLCLSFFSSLSFLLHINQSKFLDIPHRNLQYPVSPTFKNQNQNSNQVNKTMASSQPEEQKSTNSFLGNLLSGKTPAVKNMEAAWTRAGAGNNHTPGHASKLGSQEQPEKNGNGVGSKEFQDKIGDQRVEVSFLCSLFCRKSGGWTGRWKDLRTMWANINDLVAEYDWKVCESDVEWK